MTYKTGTDDRGLISLGNYENYYNEGPVGYEYGEVTESNKSSVETESRPTQGTTRSCFIHKRRNKHITSLNAGCMSFTCTIQPLSGVKLKGWQIRA